MDIRDYEGKCYCGAILKSGTEKLFRICYSCQVKYDPVLGDRKE